MQIKDLLCTHGIATSCASRILAEDVPVYDATAVACLRKQGVVLLGKGNMDEFGMGSSTENSAFFPTRNPWDTPRLPGGSIRQPASFCGVTPNPPKGCSHAGRTRYERQEKEIVRP